RAVEVVVLEPRSNNQGTDNGGQQQQQMQPVSAPWRKNDVNLMRSRRIKNLDGIAGIRHQDARKSYSPTSASWLFDRLQFFPGFEAHRFPWRNTDFRSGAGIAPDPGFPGTDIEDAKATQLDAVTGRQGL